ncbi:MAG: GNAT family N-acetyltransferase [Candidatus Bathyarchaeota archaeon]|nr:MAG: GNAT family N-acetyltransferase [Candidatus Bathyarchaeota archaeon]
MFSVCEGITIDYKESGEFTGILHFSFTFFHCFMVMRGFPEFFIGAFHEGKLAGIVIGSYEGRMKGWTNRLAVDPKYRQKGIAEQLVKTVEIALEKHGATIFCALIEVANEESLGLFQKMGYFTRQDILYVSKRKSKDV